MGLGDEIRSAVNWRTPAPAVDMEDSLRSIIQKMTEAHVSALAVRLRGHIIGVITDMDVMLGIDAGKDMNDTRASDIMTPCELIEAYGVKCPCVQLDASENVGKALRMMARVGVHNLLVWGEGEQDASMVSAHDLLRLVIS